MNVTTTAEQLALQTLWSTRRRPDGPWCDPAVDGLLRRALVRLEQEELTRDREQRCFWIVQTDQPVPWLLDVSWPRVEGAGEMELTWNLAETLDPMAALYTDRSQHALHLELERPGGWHQRARLVGDRSLGHELLADPPRTMDDGDFPRLRGSLLDSLEREWNMPAHR